MNTLTIYISRDEVPHLTKTRPFIHVRKCRVKKEDEEIYLRELLPPPAQHRYNKVKLILRGRLFSRRLRIPSQLETAILWYIHRPRLIGGPTNDDFFCRRVARVTPSHLWKLNDPGFRLQAGDILSFRQGDVGLQMAVYLGAKLCLMIWETNSELEVTSINDIKQALGATHIMVAR